MLLNPYFISVQRSKAINLPAPRSFFLRIGDPEFRAAIATGSALFLSSRYFCHEEIKNEMFLRVAARGHYHTLDYKRQTLRKNRTINNKLKTTTRCNCVSNTSTSIVITC